MTFEQDYKRLISYAGKIIKSGNLNIDPIDLVNDAFLLMANEPYTFEKATKIIIRNAYKETDTASNKNTTLDKTHYCTSCEEEKPINGFTS